MIEIDKDKYEKLKLLEGHRIRIVKMEDLTEYDNKEGVVKCVMKSGRLLGTWGPQSLDPELGDKWEVLD